MIVCKEISFSENLPWDELVEESNTATFFQTKEWLEIWLRHFPVNYKIFGVFDGEELIGVAPFSVEDKKITFLGVAPVLGRELVSDYGDIIAKTSYEKDVWKEVLAKVKSIVFNFLREDSLSFTALQSLGGKIEEIDAAPYLDLPGSWEEYLVSLDRHDRHELRRKMRKMEEGVVSKGDVDDLSEFFRLMELSSDQKRNFLKPEMRTFFQDIVNRFLPQEMLEMRFLEYEDRKIAAILYFVFKNEVLLYNSGFNPAYSHLSPGLVLNAHAIREAIEKGRKRYDFLRGGERYKYDLGGKERKLYRIVIK